MTMRTIFTAILLIAAGAFTIPANPVPADQQANETYVYICTGPKAKKYHRYSDCKGLNKCSGQIKKISLTQAKRSYTACKICY